jgi:hypothetical protein
VAPAQLKSSASAQEALHPPEKYNDFAMGLREPARYPGTARATIVNPR